MVSFCKYGTPFFDDMFELNTYIMLLVVDNIMRHHMCNIKSTQSVVLPLCTPSNYG